MRTAMIVAGAILLLAETDAQGQQNRPAERGRNLNDAETEFVELHDSYLEKFKPLWIGSTRAWWEASLSGTDEAFQQRKEAEGKLIELHGDRATFTRITRLRNGGRLTDPILKRQLDVMYYTFLPKQADAQLQKRVVSLEADVEQIFNTHRGLIDGQPKSENDIRTILAKTNDSGAAEKAWKAYMEVGAKIDGKLRELVSLRNRMSRQLGYKNFFSLRMEIQEVDEKELFKLFDELDVLTEKPFAAIKRQIDEKMAKRFGISTNELRPWHFGDLFFQEAPDVQEVNFDEVFKGRDLVHIAKGYYSGLDMPVEEIISRSDLYEKEGKSPHAFATDMNRAGDVRILCNLKPNAYWMDTLVHELAHGVYDTYLDPDLPFLLREASHSITTEGIAQMFGAMTKNEEWLKRALGLPDDEAERFVQAANSTLRIEKTLFSRWTQVMVRFEHGMYTDPDQNLGKLWWDLKKRYQLLNPPEEVNRPDYAAKMHIVGYPVYYHSYMMGDLFAAQVRHYIAVNVLGIDDPNTTCFYGRKEAGDFLRREIFAPGKRHPWNELTRRATGEPLTAKYFARQYIE